MRMIAGLTFLLCVACGSGSSNAVESNSETPKATTDEPTAVEPEETPTTETPTEVEKAPDACVEDCVASRQMQATSPEQIQLDCEKTCSEGAGEP